MKINNQTITAKHFAYDGCHKIYLIENEENKEEAKKYGYKILPISKLQETFGNSCSLRFISNWDLTTKYVCQFEDANFS